VYGAFAGRRGGGFSTSGSFNMMVQGGNRAGNDERDLELGEGDEVVDLGPEMDPGTETCASAKVKIDKLCASGTTDSAASAAGMVENAARSPARAADTGFGARCKAVGQDMDPGGYACHVGCKCFAKKDAEKEGANAEKEGENASGESNESGGNDVLGDDDNAEESTCESCQDVHQDKSTQVKKHQIEYFFDEAQKAAFKENPTFKVENSEQFCPDGAVTHRGFWVSRGDTTHSVGWCETWVEAALEGEASMFCDHLSGQEPGKKTFMCSKLSVTHPNNLPHSMGTLMGKRMLCNPEGCRVTKVGMCIDVKEAVFVPESCKIKGIEGTGCTPCDTEYNCDVPNAELVKNEGSHETTIEIEDGKGNVLKVVNKVLSMKNMRVQFAKLATAILEKNNGVLPPENMCHTAVVEKAENFLKLA